MCTDATTYHNKRERNRGYEPETKTSLRPDNFQRGKPRTERGLEELHLTGRVAVLLFIQLASFTSLMLTISANNCHFEANSCCIRTSLADGFPSPNSAHQSRIGPSPHQMLAFPSPLSNAILQNTHENRKMETLVTVVFLYTLERE